MSGASDVACIVATADLGLPAEGPARPGVATRQQFPDHEPGRIQIVLSPGRARQVETDFALRRSRGAGATPRPRMVSRLKVQPRLKSALKASLPRPRYVRQGMIRHLLDSKAGCVPGPRGWHPVPPHQLVCASACGPGSCYLRSVLPSWLYAPVISQKHDWSAASLEPNLTPGTHMLQAYTPDATAQPDGMALAIRTRETGRGSPQLDPRAMQLAIVSYTLPPVSQPPSPALLSSPMPPGEAWTAAQQETSLTPLADSGSLAPPAAIALPNAGHTRGAQELPAGLPLFYCSSSYGGGPVNKRQMKHYALCSHMQPLPSRRPPAAAPFAHPGSPPSSSSLATPPSRRPMFLPSPLPPRHRTSAPTTLDVLPYDILLRIVCLLHHDHLPPLLLTCKTLNYVAQTARYLHFNFTTPQQCKACSIRGALAWSASVAAAAAPAPAVSSVHAFPSPSPSSRPLISLSGLHSLACHCIRASRTPVPLLLVPPGAPRPPRRMSLELRQLARDNRRIATPLFPPAAANTATPH